MSVDAGDVSGVLIQLGVTMTHLADNVSRLTEAQAETHRLLVDHMQLAEHPGGAQVSEMQNRDTEQLEDSVSELSKKVNEHDGTLRVVKSVGMIMVPTVSGIAVILIKMLLDALPH